MHRRHFVGDLLRARHFECVIENTYTSLKLRTVNFVGMLVRLAPQVLITSH